MNEPTNNMCGKNYYYCDFSNLMYDIFRCKTHFYNNVNVNHFPDIKSHFIVLYFLFYVF